MLLLGVMQRVATEISVLQSIKHPLLPTLHQVYTTGDNIFMEMTVSAAFCSSISCCMHWC
jgi:hypothetical protein